MKTQTTPEIVQSLEEALRQAKEQNVTLQAIQEVARSLTSELHLDTLLQKIMAAAVEVMNASAGSLMLVDTESHELVFTVAEGGGGEQLVGMRMQQDIGIAGWVATNRKSLIVDDVSEDNRYYQAIAQQLSYHVNSILCVPMLSRKRLIGVLQLLHSKTGRYFNPLDEQLLTIFANQSAIAIENARLHQSLVEEHERLIRVEEDVRKRLARDLHDGPTQLVSSIIMNMDFVRQLQNMAADPALIQEEIDRTEQFANHALKQLRTLLFDLRPVILETQGVVPALEVYAQKTSEVEKFDIVVTIEREFERLSKNAAVSIFAVVQEAVNNAKKYAQASRINLILRVDAAQDQMTVLIEDDGKGFDVAEVQQGYDNRGSLGMINSKERAATVKGTFQINSQVGAGTQVVLTLPYSENLMN